MCKKNIRKKDMTRVKKAAKKVHCKYFEKHQNNPHSVRQIDKLMTTIGFIGPIATFTQVFYIYSARNVEGISVVSWMAYIFVNLCWFLYGFLHKSKPLVVVNMLGMLACLLIVCEFFVFS